MEIEKSKSLLAASKVSAEKTLQELNTGVNVDDRLSGGGASPLATAVTFGHYEAMTLLLGAGASPCSAKGLTALTVSHNKWGLPAVLAAHLRLVRMLDFVIGANEVYGN